MEAVVAIVAMICATTLVVLGAPFWLVKRFLDQKVKIEELKASRSEAALQDRLRPVREEMAQLRQETNDLILSFDTTLQRLEARVQELERKAALASGEQTASLPRGTTTQEAIPPEQARQSVRVGRQQ